MLHVDGFRQIRGKCEEAVIRDIVHPLDDFRDGAARSSHLARFSKQRYGYLLLRARKPVDRRHILRLYRQITYPQPLVQEWIGLAVEMKSCLVLYGVTDGGQSVGQPVPNSVAVQKRHYDVDICLELDQP